MLEELPPEWEGEDDEEEEPSPSGAGARPRYPQEFASFHTSEPRIWELGPPPIGSVLTLTLQPVEDGNQPAIVALLVVVTLEREDGFWVQVKLLGCDQVWAKAQVVSDFSRSKKQVHICRAPLESGCTNIRGVHVTEFGVWPPGQFQGSYVDAKKMSGMRKFLEEIGTIEGPTPTAGKDATTPARLAALRQRLFAAREGGAGFGKSVSFATPAGVPGILKRKKASDALTPKLEKPTTISSESEMEVAKVKKKSRPSKEPSISAALYAAVEKRQNHSKSSARSPSPDVKSTKDKKKKKKKKKEKKSSSGSSSTSSPSESSSDDLKPPLQKKAERKPGSVLKMLMDHVRLSLSDLSLGDSTQEGAESAVNSAARVQSYFQIMVRPQLNGRPRDEKELFSLSLALDYLRAGQVTRVADLLAGRYLAVETAALEGSWETARWLEVSRLEDRGATPAQVLLAARKHQKTIDRASGRGTYNPGSWGAGYYAGGHYQDGAGGFGRGRGGRKGKDGKGKGKKGGKKKNGDKAWWDDPQSQKEAEKGKGETQK